MKKYLLIPLIALIFGCSSEPLTIEGQDNPVDTDQMYSIRLNIPAIIETEYESLTRADSPVYYGIYLERNKTGSYQRYAYGQFSSPDNIEIMLHSGEYRICVALFENYEQYGIEYPFIGINIPDGIFVLDQVDKLTYNMEGIYSFNIDTGFLYRDGNLALFPGVRQYCSIIEGFNPEVSSELSISLERNYNRVRFAVENLPSGRVEFSYAGYLDHPIIVDAGQPELEVDIPKVYFDRDSEVVVTRIKWIMDDGTEKLISSQNGYAFRDKVSTFRVVFPVSAETGIDVIFDEGNIDGENSHIINVDSEDL